MKKIKGDQGFIGGLYYKGNLVIQDSGKVRGKTWWECKDCGKITKSISPVWQREHLDNPIHTIIWKIKTLFGVKKHKNINWYGYKLPKDYKKIAISDLFKE